MFRYSSDRNVGHWVVLEHRAVNERQFGPSVVASCFYEENDDHDPIWIDEEIAFVVDMSIIKRAVLL